MFRKVVWDGHDEVEGDRRVLDESDQALDEALNKRKRDLVLVRRMSLVCAPHHRVCGGAEAIGKHWSGENHEIGTDAQFAQRRKQWLIWFMRNEHSTLHAARITHIVPLMTNVRGTMKCWFTHHARPVPVVESTFAAMVRDSTEDGSYERFAPNWHGFLRGKRKKRCLHKIAS